MFLPLVALLAPLPLLSPPEGIFSGPQKGEKTPPFKVLDLNGPNQGKEIDYITAWKGAPTVLCFIHELTRPSAQLFRRLDEYGARNKDALKTLFVSLTEDVQKSERGLPATIKSLQMKSIVSVSLDGKEGPGSYGLNKEVLLTIIIARENSVVASWAIVSPNETDFPRIQAVLDKLLEPALDSPESMKAEILRLRGELAALRAEVEALKQDRGEVGGRPERMESRPDRTARGVEDKPGERKGGQGDFQGKAPSDPMLLTLFRRLIQPDKSPPDVDKVIEEIEAYVKESVDLQAQVRDGLKLIDELGYGTDYSKSSRKKLSEKYKK